MDERCAVGRTEWLADGVSKVVELCWVMSDGRSGGLNYYNIYNKDIGTGGIKVLFEGGWTDRIVLIYIGIVFFLKGFVFFWLRIVLKGSKIVFFLNMGEEGSFTNILEGK